MQEDHFSHDEVLFFCGLFCIQSVNLAHCSGGSTISGKKGVHMFEGVGFRFADFISFFLNIP